MKRKIISIVALVSILFTIFAFPCTVSAANRTTITVQDAETNTAISGSVIKITTSSGATVSFDAVGGSYSYSENGSTSSLSTNSGGKIILSGLPNGQYKATQIQNPSGYQDDLKSKSFSAGTSNISFYNNKKYGALSIKVVDSATKKQLTKAGFSLKDSSGNNVKFSFKNNSYVFSGGSGSTVTNLTTTNGVINIYQLPVGKYTLTQISAPQTYTAAKDVVINVENTRNSQKVITVSNVKKPGSLSISSPVHRMATYSIYSNNTPLKFNGGGGNYEYKSNGSTTLLRSENGKISVTNIPSGDYTLRIDSAPDGYTAVRRYNSISIIPGQTTNINIEFKLGDEHSSPTTPPSQHTTNPPSQPTTNTPSVQSNFASIKVSDETGKGVEGVQIAIKTESNADVRAGSTSKTGVYSMSGLKPGKYVYLIQSVPDGYFYAKKSYKFTVKSNGDVENFSDLKVTAKAVYVQYPDKVAGASFSATDSFGDTLLVVDTDKKGIAVFRNLPAETYTIKQTAAPEGHKLYIGSSKVIVDNNFNNYNNMVVIKDEVSTVPVEGTTSAQDATESQKPEEPHFEDNTIPAVEKTDPVQETVPPEAPPEEEKGEFPWLIVVLCVVIFGAGFAAGFLFIKNRKTKDKDNQLINNNLPDDELDDEPGDDVTDSLLSDDSDDFSLQDNSQDDVDSTSEDNNIPDTSIDSQALSDNNDASDPNKNLYSFSSVAGIMLDQTKKPDENEEHDIVSDSSLSENEENKENDINTDDYFAEINRDEEEQEDVSSDTYFEDEDEEDDDDSDFGDLPEESIEQNKGFNTMPYHDSDFDDVGDLPEEFQYQAQDEFLDLNDDDDIDSDFGYLPNTTERAEDKNIREKKELDYIYGGDVGKLKQSKNSNIKENKMELDAKSDVGYLDHKESKKSDTAKKEQDEAIDSIYGDEFGEVQQNEATDKNDSDEFLKDSINEDVGELGESNTNKTEAHEEKQEQENIDSIYGDDVGEI